MILQKNDKILLIKRGRDPFKDKFALPGGFVNENESVEYAILREMKEETNLDVEPIEILGVYSNPERDPRAHIVTIVFIGIIIGGSPLSGDDSKEIMWYNIEEISNIPLAFDHNLIIQDYIEWRKNNGTFWSSKPRSFS